MSKKIKEKVLKEKKRKKKELKDKEYIRGILSAIKIEELYDKDKMAMLIAKEKFINSLSDEQKKLYDEYCSKRIDFYITASGLHNEESFINL